MNIEGIFPRFLLLIATGCCLAEGISSTELKQMSEIVKKLEEKIDNQDLYTGSILILHLLHNGAQLKESVSSSYNNGDGNGKIEEMFSRTVVSTYVSQFR